MMITNLKETRPTARKPHWCSLCTGPIKPGEVYCRSTNVFDGRVYDWLTCSACAADMILSRVNDWSFFLDEGVTAETAHEWASEQAVHGSGDEQVAAKKYLERVGE